MQEVNPLYLDFYLHRYGLKAICYKVLLMYLYGSITSFANTWLRAYGRDVCIIFRIVKYIGCLVANIVCMFRGWVQVNVCFVKTMAHGPNDIKYCCWFPVNVMFQCYLLYLYLQCVLRARKWKYFSRRPRSGCVWVVVG